MRITTVTTLTNIKRVSVSLVFMPMGHCRAKSLGVSSHGATPFRVTANRIMGIRLPRSCARSRGGPGLAAETQIKRD
eukprot:1317220-Pyramimonas_sp.AAC.1